MRDMLERLKTISEEQGDWDRDRDPDSPGPESEADEESLSQQAVLFESSSPTDDILSEAYSIRLEIAALQSEVRRLAAHNERFGTSVRRLTLIKRDSDSIARGIQQRGEALYARLQALGRASCQLEESEGPHSAASRIARVQYDTLNRAFHDTMSDYSDAEERQRCACRGRIQRQASIMGTEITNEQLDEMVHKGGEGWAELSQSLQNPGARSTTWAMTEIKGRHKELVELEARMKEVHELFLQMAMMVEEQGSMINNIEANVCGTQEYTEKIKIEINRALQYKKKNPFLQCCACLPCWRQNKIF